jgi:hypothetical protein
MDKKQYQEWLDKMENEGLDDAEIEAAVQDYLDQPESQEWFFAED